MRAVFPVLLLLAACGDDDGVRTRSRAVPVTVLRLEVRDMNREAALTGSAEPYREEAVGFEVGGCVAYVVALGTEVEGFTVRTDPGCVPDEIASADVRDFELTPGDHLRQVAAADIEGAARDVDAAEAAVTLARGNLRKAQQLLASGAGTQQALDDSRSAYDQAVARLQQARAALTTKQATIELKRAPFAGRRHPGRAPRPARP